MLRTPSSQCSQQLEDGSTGLVKGDLGGAPLSLLPSGTPSGLATGHNTPKLSRAAMRGSERSRRASCRWVKNQHDSHRCGEPRKGCVSQGIILLAVGLRLSLLLV